MSQQPDPRISELDRQIMAMIAADKTTVEVGQALNRSVHTIRSRLRLIFARLGVDSQAAMVGKAAWLGLINLNEVYGDATDS